MRTSHTVRLLALQTTLVLLPAACQAETSPLNRWLFDRTAFTGEVIAAASGPLPMKLQGEGRARFVGPAESAVYLDGQEHSIATMPVRLPPESFSLETWVLLPGSQEQGRLVGLAAEAVGPPEKGTVLDFRDHRFRFGLRTDADDKMLYVTSPKPIAPRKWHHVVGTYDGQTAALYVDGRSVAASDAIRGKLQPPGNGLLEVGRSGEKQHRHRTEAMFHEVGLYGVALSPDEIADRFQAKAGALPSAQDDWFERLVRFHGPFAEFVGPGQVAITWESDQPTTTAIEFGTDITQPRRWNETELVREHCLLVDEVAPGTIYKYRIRAKTEDGQQLLTETYEFDSHFDYRPIDAGRPASPYPEDDRTATYNALASRMIEACGTRRGYVLLLGAADGRLAFELARQSDLQIVIVEPDAAKADWLRNLFDRTGLYGVRVTVHHGDFQNLPYGEYFANLIVSETALTNAMLPGKLESLYRCLRPAGGVLYLGTWCTDDEREAVRAKITRWYEGVDLSAGKSEFVQEEGTFWIHRRGKLPGAGEWTHQYALPDNSACSQDEWLRGELAVQWWGRPGARPMPDRGNRNPAPVSANGRLFIQGNRTLFGIDAYNGTILWSQQIPTMRRANVPRDGSNMVATDDMLYIVMGDRCVGFNGQTGQREVNFRIPVSGNDPPSDWGYLANVDDLLIGSTVARGTLYVGDNGEWYEGFGDEHIGRVMSRRLFALDRHTGQLLWKYEQGLVMNSTVTIADNLVSFVESRDPSAQQHASRRLVDEVLRDQHLVALDLTSGRVRWQRPCDFGQCKYMTYMVYGNNTLLVTGTDEKRRFHTYAMDVGSGTELWRHE
ncbi:MAG: LamG-like jellyroll fold domain-containing protein, partial [Pirellulales bacterium]